MFNHALEVGMKSVASTTLAILYLLRLLVGVREGLLSFRSTACAGELTRSVLLAIEMSAVLSLPPSVRINGSALMRIV
jgi:hypothetical protein